MVLWKLIYIHFIHKRLNNFYILKAFKAISFILKMWINRIFLNQSQEFLLDLIKRYKKSYKRVCGFFDSLIKSNSYFKLIIALESLMFFLLGQFSFKDDRKKIKVALCTWYCYNLLFYNEFLVLRSLILGLAKFLSFIMVKSEILAFNF